MKTTLGLAVAYSGCCCCCPRDCVVNPARANKHTRLRILLIYYRCVALMSKQMSGRCSEVQVDCLITPRITQSGSKRTKHKPPCTMLRQSAYDVEMLDVWKVILQKNCCLPNYVLKYDQGASYWHENDDFSRSDSTPVLLTDVVREIYTIKDDPG